MHPPAHYYYSLLFLSGKISIEVIRTGKNVVLFNSVSEAANNKNNRVTVTTNGQNPSSYTSGTLSHSPLFDGNITEKPELVKPSGEGKHQLASQRKLLM